MAKNISSGIERLLKKDSAQEDQHAKQWQQLRNRLDSILLSTNVLKSDEVRQRCLKLDDMNFEQRRAYIQDNWGELYLEKTMPLLQQLETLEQFLYKLQNPA